MNCPGKLSPFCSFLVAKEIEKNKQMKGTCKIYKQTLENIYDIEAIRTQWTCCLFFQTVENVNSYHVTYSLAVLSAG